VPQTNRYSLSNGLSMIRLLSYPAFLYFVAVLIINVFSLFVVPLKCDRMGMMLCAGLFILSFLLTLVLLIVVTWVIDKIYVSGYTFVAWILSVGLILFQMNGLFKIDERDRERERERERREREHELEQEEREHREPFEGKEEERNDFEGKDEEEERNDLEGEEEFEGEE